MFSAGRPYYRGDTAGFCSPTEPNNALQISHVFGSRPFTPHISTTGYDYDFHRGVDFGGAGTVTGDPHYAATGGAVVRTNYTHFHWRVNEQLDQFVSVEPTFAWSFAFSPFLEVTATGASASWDVTQLSRLTAANSIIFTNRDNWVLELKLAAGFGLAAGRCGIGLFNGDASEYIALDYNGASFMFHGVSAGGAFSANGTTYASAGMTWLRIEYDLDTDTLSWRRSTDGENWTTLGSQAGLTFTELAWLPALFWRGTAVGTDTFSVEQLNWVDEAQTIGRFGNWVTINRTDGKIVQVHMNTVSARPGDFVAAGEQIGTVGRTGFNVRSGRITGVHVHLEWSNSTLAAYDQDEALNPLDAGILPRAAVDNNMAVVITEGPDPDAVVSWIATVTVTRADSDFDFNQIECIGNSATRTINFNTRAGLNPDNDIPKENGTYIVPADGFDLEAPAYVVAFYFHKSVVGTSVTVNVYDTSGALTATASA